MIEQLKKIHLKVERFFEARKREASLKRAVALWLLASLFVSILSVFSGVDFGLLLVASSLVVVDVLKVLWQNFLVAGFVFLVVAGVFTYVGRSLFAGAGSFKQVLYLTSQPLLFLFASYLFLYFTSSFLPFLNVFYILFGALAVYFSLIVLKVAHEISYFKVIGLLIAGFAARSILGYLFVFFILLFSQNTVYTDRPATTTLTNNSDGSITINYSNVNGDCLITFPSGWTPATKEETKKLLRPDMNIMYIQEYELIYKNKEINFTGAEEYAWFDGTPPISMRGDIRKSCEKNTFEYDKNFTQIYRKTSLIKQNFMEACDAKFVNSENNIIHHYILTDFFNGLGFEFKYISTSGNDADLQYILGNMVCNRLLEQTKN